MSQAIPESQRLSAGTLRGMGIAIPDEIPDCAWVPRDSVKMDTVAKGETVAVVLTFKEPWRWVEATVTLEGKKP